MPPRPPSALSYKALFLAFFEAGIFGFGGVLPIARRVLVERRRWLSQPEFNELFSLCQTLPGANMVNFAFAYGARQRGAGGAVAAVLGIMAAPMALVMLFGGLYARYGGLAPVRHALAGLAAAAAGLMLGAGVKIAAPVLRSARHAALVAAVLALVALAHWPLVLAMLAVLPVSLLLAWRAAR